MTFRCSSNANLLWTLAPSNAISRYVGKRCDLYPEDALHALRCDEVLEALEDINHYLVQTFRLKDEELKLARQALLEGRLKTFLVGLSELLTPMFVDYCQRIDNEKIVRAYYDSLHS